MTKFKRKRITKRERIKQPDAIFSADWHLQESTPVCRTDDFWSAQDKKINFIFDLAERYGCPIFISGDIGHKPRWSCKLLEWFIDKVNNYNVEIYCVLGQHDLINHRFDLWEHTGVGVLQAAGVIEILFEPTIINDTFGLFPYNWGEDIKNIKLVGDGSPNVAMTHQMIIEDKELWPGQEAPKGNQLLKKYSCYDLILSGDNHLSFVAEYQDRKLVNPGSMMRTNASQINHLPRIYLYYADANEIEAVYLPIEKDVISREHIEVAQERESRNKVFIERVNNDVEIELSYENNLENYFNKYRTEKSIVEKTWEHVK